MSKTTTKQSETQTQTQTETETEDMLQEDQEFQETENIDEAEKGIGRSICICRGFRRMR